VLNSFKIYAASFHMGTLLLNFKALFSFIVMVVIIHALKTVYE